MPMENKPEFHAGDTHFKLADLQALVRMIPRVIRGGVGINIRNFGDRIVIESTDNQAPPSAGSKIALFKVTEERDDYLVCVRYSPGVEESEEDEEPATFNVAKPFLLRKTPFHNQTIDYGRGKIKYTYDTTGDPFEIGARLAEVIDIEEDDDNMEETDVGTKEAQIISPPYYIEEIITAVQGETGVTDSEGNAISWSDLNTGARCWSHNSRHDPDDPNDE